MMGRLMRNLVIVAAIAASLLPPPARADDAVDLSVVGVSANTLAISTVESEFDWPLLIRRNDGQAGAKVAIIDSSLLVGPGGRTYPLRLRKDNADFAGELSLEPYRQAQLQLVATLPDPGDYTGELRLRVDGKVQAVTIKIVRAVREVTVVGATAGGLTLSTPEPALDWSITVRRNDTAAGPRPVDIALSTLTGPSGRVQPIKLKRGDADFDGHARLEPMSQIELRLIGTVPEAGDYSGEFSIVVDGKRQLVPLKITRALKDSPIRIEEVAQTRATLGDQLPLRVRVQETEGVPYRFRRPEVVRLDQKDGAALVQAKYLTPRVLMPDGKGAPEIIPLGANQMLNLQIVIDGMDEPGAYSGVLRVTSDTRKIVDKAFEIGLRRGAWFAGIMIFIGVVISTGLRGWLTSARPAIVLRQSAAATREKLFAFRDAERDLNDEEHRIIGAIASNLDALMNPDADQSAAELQTKLDVIRRKITLLPDWVSLRRRLDGVQPPSIGDAVRTHYDSVTALLKGNALDQPATESNLTSLQTTWPNELDAAVASSLRTAIGQFRQEIARLPDVQKDAMRPYDRALEQVNGLAVKDLIARAPAALREARKAYAAIVIKAMQDMVAAAPNPVGITPANWATLQQSLREQLVRAAAEPDETDQIEAWKRARIFWLREVSKGLGVRIKETQARANDKAKPILQDAANTLAGVEPALQANNIEAAQVAYESAVKRYKDAQAEDNTLGVTGGGPVPADGGVGTGAPNEVIMAAAANAVGIVLGGATSAAAIALRLFVADAVLFVVLSIIAVMVGLNLLYYDKPTWGGATDIAAALLWGFGLHSVAGNAFQGIQGLASQILGVKA